LIDPALLPHWRTHTLAEKSAELGLQTASLGELGAVLAGSAPGRTRVLRGFDANVDRAILAYEPDREKPRDRELAWVLSELKLVKDEWEIAQLQAAIDATVHGFEDVVRVLPADRGVKVYSVGIGTKEGETIGFEGWSMRVRLDEDTLKNIASVTRAEYFYAGTADDLMKVYQSLSTRLVVEKKETEISGLFAAAAALLVVVAAGLSVAWFGRVM